MSLSKPFPWSQVAIAGVYNTRQARSLPGETDRSLVVESVLGALDDAGLGIDDVGMIVAHGNGTPQSDASEAAALRRVFGGAMPPVTANIAL